MQMQQNVQNFTLGNLNLANEMSAGFLTIKMNVNF